MIHLDEVRQRLIETRLMTAQCVQDCIAHWQTEVCTDGESGEDLLAWLVKQQLLTEFQRNAICTEHRGPLVIGPYRLLDRAVVGRLGDVYRAMHEEVNQAVSLKVFSSAMKDSPEQFARMQREIRVSAELDHPNIVRMFEVGKEGDLNYLAFEDLQGETLQERLSRQDALPYSTACRLILDAALGLGCLHDRFLVHRDVCPANLWITEAGRAKVMELGAVRPAFSAFEGDEGLTTMGSSLGTCDYMAPEQAQDAHAADHRADIYSLGCTLYHCLTGQPPFSDRNPLRVMMRHATEPPASIGSHVEGIPAALEETIATMLAKLPEDRFQSMEDVARALEEFADPSAGDGEHGTVVLDKYITWLRQS